ncbi:unnamed protein product [Mycena citricolor]|uniref:Protein OS-9 homolog n=1 Tax=Mycena citricolor TaxID=2018698 RepID=A0AAD2HKU8_9AGAR|nr:unnamed protein product [Mycena citricolor]CAK5277732.1 unnamed protein product [Mycena citricolor]
MRRWPLLLLPAVAARLSSLPEDPYAFPKFAVDFLDHLPVPNDTAQRWLANGIRGGQREFLGQPWEDPRHPPALGNGNEQQAVLTEDVVSTPDVSNDFSLDFMKMGADEYICLIPKPLEHLDVEEEAEEEPEPMHTWSLLLPLVGNCLYHRQPWFTYSYCHNKEIRQFRELIQARPAAGAAHHPEEDPTWESYTLGRAPEAAIEPGAELTVAQQDAIAANVELARSTGSRYLVQRWGDGTVCDKSGKPREVEVQFHCSMTTTDAIAFVKETKTCAYVLVVHTPRLCGEPGFMSKKDAGEQATISCRQIVAEDRAAEAGTRLSAGTDHPLKLARPKPVLPVPAAKGSGSGGTIDGLLDAKHSDALRKAIGTLKDGDWKSGTPIEMEMVEDEEGNIVVQFYDGLEDIEEGGDVVADMIVKALRDEGFNIRVATEEEEHQHSKNKKKRVDEN